MDKDWMRYAEKQKGRPGLLLLLAYFFFNIAWGWFASNISLSETVENLLHLFVVWG